MGSALEFSETLVSRMYQSGRSVQCVVRTPRLRAGIVAQFAPADSPSGAFLTYEQLRVRMFQQAI